MDKILTYLSPEHTGGFHFVGLFFCLIGIFLTKYHFYLKHKKECEVSGQECVFNVKYWLKMNWSDALASLVASFMFVRFLDPLLHYLNPKIKVVINFELPVTEDQLFYYFAAGVVITALIHKLYRKKKNVE